MAIIIDGKKYKVIETLPYHQAGRPTKVIVVEGKEKVAVKEHGKWRFWTPEDRLRG